MPDDKRTSQAATLSELTLKLVATCQRRQEMIAENAELSWSEYKCLRAFKNETILSVKEIAGRMHLTSSRLTRIIDGLVKKRYATRHIDSDDRRIINVTLTSVGAKLSARVSGDCVNVYETVLSQVDPSTHDAIISALTNLCDTLSQQTTLEEL